MFLGHRFLLGFCLLFFFCVFPESVTAQVQTEPRISVRFSGTVRSKDSGEVVPGVSIAIIGTTRGAKANRNGEFSILLEPDKKQRIRVTAVGFRPDTLEVLLKSSEVQNIVLTPQPIESKQIVISGDQSRIEARRIMHKVIEHKDEWLPQIQDYAFKVYAKSTFETVSAEDTSVKSVLETASEAYWKRVADSTNSDAAQFAERILARKQTANIPAAANRIGSIRLANLYNERVYLPGYAVVSPVARDAFDRYDYDLIGTGELNGSKVFKILLDPNGVLSPAFEGVLWIDQTDYTIAYLNIHLNGAVKLPFLKAASMEQSFILVENKYWLPQETHFSVTAGPVIAITPDFRLQYTGVMQDYVVNHGLPQSILPLLSQESDAGWTREIDSNADKIDTVRWAALRSIPLTPDESNAYRHLDSARSLAVAQPVVGPGYDFSIAPGYEFNRVEGSRVNAFFGWSALPFLTPNSDNAWPLAMESQFGYSITGKRFNYAVKLTQPLTWDVKEQTFASLNSAGDFSASTQKTNEITSSLSFKIYDDLERAGIAYNSLVNTLTALLLKLDYPDRYRTRGEWVDLNLKSGSASYDLELRDQREESISKITDKGILFPSKLFRDNPPINDGRYRGAKLTLTKELSGDRFFGGVTGTWSVYGQIADKAFGSDFNFSSAGFSSDITFKLGAFGTTNIQLAANSILSGAFGDQHLYIFEARNMMNAVRSSFRTMSPMEFQGDRTAQLLFQQNFYDLPTRLLGLHFLKPLDLHWIGFAGAGWSMVTKKTEAFLAVPTQATGNTPYVEAGIGLANIFNILRIDASWRLTHRHPKNSFLTGSLEFSF